MKQLPSAPRVEALIILENVLIKGFDSRVYTINYHVKPNAINAIVTPALFNKDILARIILGLYEPETGRVAFLKDIRRKCYYNSLHPLPQYREISSYVDEYAGKDVLKQLVEKMNKLGYKIDEYTVFGEIPYSLRIFIALFTLINSNSELCVLVDPFEYLDDALTRLVGVEMGRAVEKGATILIITSNESAIGKLHVHNLLDLTLGLRTEKVIVDERSYLFGYALIEVYARGDKVSDHIMKLLEQRGFRGFIIRNNKFTILVEKSSVTKVLLLLSRMVREKRIRGFRVVEVR